MARPLVKWRVEGNKVRAFHQFLEGNEFSAQILRVVFRKVRVVHQNAHAQRGYFSGQEAAYASAAKKPTNLATQAAQRRHLGNRPIVFPRQTDGRDHLPVEHQRERQGVVGNFVHTVVRIIGHEDAEFGGKTIPKNSMVWAMLAAANRDHERFPNPDSFDIERCDNDHLAFGGGPHFCLGYHLAQLEARAAIGTLVRRFRDLRLESDTVEWGRSLFRVPARLPISFRAV